MFRDHSLSVLSWKISFMILFPEVTLSFFFQVKSGL